MGRYRFVREHLDDLVELVVAIYSRRAIPGNDAVRAAEQDLAITSLGERIEQRLQDSVAAGFELPLDRVRTAFQLTPTEQRCLELALALAVSGQVRALAGHSSGVTTLDAIDELVYSHHTVRDRFADEVAAHGRLFRFGLLELADDADSRFGRSLRASDRIIDLVYGSTRDVDLGGAISIVRPAVRMLSVELAHLDHARRVLGRNATAGDGPILAVIGPDGVGRRSLIAHIASELDARLLEVHCNRLRPDDLAATLRAIQREAVLARAVVVLTDLDDSDLARSILASFDGYTGPVAAIASSDGLSSAGPRRGLSTIELVRPSEEQRVELWSRHVGDALANEAAMRYRLTNGQIERAAEVARAHRGGGADALDLEAIHIGVRTVLDSGLSTLGVRIEWAQTWEDLVLPTDSRDELTELVERVRCRRKVIDEWGFGAKVAKGLGVAALFHGPPGTGKTMAAGLVAKALKLDLYQIDVSRLVSKYIGETEKNLAKVFDAAEAGHAVLLFDEADSLFAKRTEVKSSVDRYANLEVNYLLQRMESFGGITILTTNFETSLDEAFRRRLAYRIHFPVPEQEERERLWRAVIPPVALGKGIDFATLAERFAMTGGYIKNAAMRAAFLAASEDRTIGMAHLLRAATAEYASMGKVMHGSLPGGSLGR